METIQKYRWHIILINLILLMIYFNFEIVKKEKLIQNSKPILLELAPVDPRSLMQGDYMVLRYKMVENLNTDSVPAKGYIVVHVDENNVAIKQRIQPVKTPIKPNEQLIKFTKNNNINIQIGAESFFFQEGKASLFNEAKYGGLYVDENGNSLLSGLYDSEFKLIK